MEQVKEEKQKIEFKEFEEIEKKLEIKVGHVSEAEEVPKSSKLIKMTVEFWDEKRTVVTNIKPQLGEFWKEALINKKFLFVTNLKPVTMMGIESTAMIMPGEISHGILGATVNGFPGEKIL